MKELLRTGLLAKVNILYIEWHPKILSVAHVKKLSEEFAFKHGIQLRDWAPDSFSDYSYIQELHYT